MKNKLKKYLSRLRKLRKDFGDVPKKERGEHHRYKKRNLNK